jgi:hypothetical protein
MPTAVVRALEHASLLLTCLCCSTCGKLLPPRNRPRQRNVSGRRSSDSRHVRVLSHLESSTAKRVAGPTRFRGLRRGQRPLRRTACHQRAGIAVPASIPEATCRAGRRPANPARELRQIFAELELAQASALGGYRSRNPHRRTARLSHGVLFRRCNHSLKKSWPLPLRARHHSLVGVNPPFSYRHPAA